METRIEYDAATLRPLNTKTFYQNAQVGGMSETIYHDEPNNYRVKSRTQIDTGKWVETIAYFDGLGRAYKAEEINSQGNIFIEKEFDEDGRVKRVTNPFRAGEVKQWTTNIYDEASRIREVILPDGAKVKTDYGVSVSGILGVTKQITDQAGKKRKGISDALGRMIRVIEDPDGQNLSTDYVFDTLGNLRKTIQGEQNRFFTYDSLGRLLYAKQPEQEANTAFIHTDTITNNSQWSVTYEYDDNGNITRTTDAMGVYVEGTYDNFNRLKTRNYSDSTPDVSFFYDGTGLGSIPARSKGKTTKVTSSVSETRYTGFDELGRLTASQQITDGQTYNFGYQYNLTTLISETYPSGRTVSYEFNTDGALSRVAGQTANSSKTYANSFNYNTAGAIESFRLGNGKWETAKYNTRQQIIEIGLGNSATDASLLKLEYGYGTNTQNNGSLRSQKISFNGLANPFEQTYAYDDLNRLLSAEEKVSNQTTWKQTFTYDRYGNRRFDANNTTTLPQSNNVTNPQIDTATNRFSAGQNYLYDKNGSLTQDANGKQFLYDAENHQREVKDASNQTIATYHYDGEGRRIKKVLINSGEETIFVYDAGGQLAAEYVINPASQIETPSTNYLTVDHLGSPRIITNEIGNITTRKDYMAFGEETSTPQRTESLGYQPAN